MVTNDALDLLLPWVEFCSPATSCHPSTQEVWEERLSVKAEARKVLESLSLYLIHCFQFPSLACWGRKTPFNLPVVVDRPLVAFLLVIFTPGKVQAHLHLGLPDFLPT